MATLVPVHNIAHSRDMKLPGAFYVTHNTTACVAMKEKENIKNTSKAFSSKLNTFKPNDLRWSIPNLPQSSVVQNPIVGCADVCIKIRSVNSINTGTKYEGKALVITPIGNIIRSLIQGASDATLCFFLDFIDWKVWSCSLLDTMFEDGKV